LIWKPQGEVVFAIKVLDLIEKHLDAKPRDAISSAFKQDCEYLLREPTTEQVGKRK
jgi:hypothetical protein